MDSGAQQRTLANPDFDPPLDGISPCDAAIDRALSAQAQTDGLAPALLRFPPGRKFVVDAVDLGQYARPVIIDARGAKLVKQTPAEGGKVEHMFRDTDGAADGSRVIGGLYDMRRAAFAPGETVSPFFLVRADDWAFRGLRIVDGIEEGLKIYKGRNVSVEYLTVDNVRNNGIQFHNPDAHEASGGRGDGFTGDLGRKPNRDTEDCHVFACEFRDIDDDNDGAVDGEGVTVNSTDPTYTARGVWVTHSRFHRCIRGVWAEFNTPGVWGEDIHFEHNVVTESEFHGIGMIGCRNSTILSNSLRDIGLQVPGPGTSSEVFGIIVGGSEGLPSEDVVVDANSILDTRAVPLMQYGIIVRASRRVSVGESNRVLGATVQAVSIAPEVDPGGRR